MSIVERVPRKEMNIFVIICSAPVLYRTSDKATYQATSLLTNNRKL